MGNRVEELETQVAQLQAAVDGLTEELVETKERLRQLETATEIEPSAETDSAHAEFVPNGSAANADDGDADAETAEATADDSDEDNSPEVEDGSDDGDDGEESDDIIVA